MKTAFANDHAAAGMRKEILNDVKKESSGKFLDYGDDSTEPVDYPDMAQKAVEAVLRGEVDRAVLVCGTGLGMSITSNKYPGIRCALCTDEYSARMAREHNDANVLALRGRHMDPEMNRKIIRTFFHTKFGGGRHQRRLDKIAEIEKKVKEM